MEKGEKMHKEISIKTQKRSQMIDITQAIENAVSEEGIMDGIVVVYSPHTTAGITINEGADPDVVHDILMQLDEAHPWNHRKYLHGEGNTAAHIKTSLVGVSQSIPVIGGKMLLGRWQSIYFCEFDGPRSRTCHVKMIGGR
jgi:secondary thiamine-phosphate synthase enzyme